MTQTVILRGNQQRTLARRLIDLAPADAVVKVSKPKRSVAQSDTMWGLLSDVSRSQPGGRKMVPEVWKCVFLHALGHSVRFEQGINGEPFPIGFSSSRLTKAQMSDLIEFIRAWGSENDVRWSF